LLAFSARGQFTKDPFPDPIPAASGAVVVNFVEFAVIPHSGYSSAQ